MYLQGKNYTAPEVTLNTISDEKKNEIKSAIRTFCPADAKKLYGEIIAEIQNQYAVSNEYFTNDQIAEIIDEVKTEEDYTLPEPAGEPAE